MKTGTLPNGARGIDCNSPLTESAAVALKTKGYQFVIRYVRRSQAHAYDVSQSERDIILNAGLGLMIVQHVAPPGWVPRALDGITLGEIAAQECMAVGVPASMNVWLDLEGVAKGTSHQDVIDFCNNWFGAVADKGFTPGLYVGDACGLTPSELHASLKFQHYWSAYNLNSDEVPAVRGVQMRQSAAHPNDLIDGFTNQNMDVDTIQADALGGTPVLAFAGE